MGASGAYLAITIGITALAAVSAGGFECARYCKEDSYTFGYQVGKTYTYSYHGNIRTFINTTNHDESGIELRCTLEISSLSTCEYVMKINDAAAYSYQHENYSDQYASFSLPRKLQQHVLQFSFHNGKIENVCADYEEDTEVLNIKRGILSSFQNSIQDLNNGGVVYETDVLGTCETNYEVLHSEVRKTKNLNACVHRSSHYFSWQSVPYASNGKSLPLLRSSVECVQRYDQDILVSATCSEKHIFQPFSNSDNGAIMESIQELIHLSTSDGTISFTSDTRSRNTLMYEDGNFEEYPNGYVVAMDLFGKLEKKTSDGIDGDVPQLFSDLVFNFRNLDKQQLLKVYGGLSSKQKEFYIDAVSLVTNTAGIETMIELFNTKQINEKQINRYTTSLSFVKNATIHTTSAMIPLLSMDATKKSSTLAVSSIIHKFCKTQNDCINNKVIKQVLHEIEKPLQNRCVSKGQKQDDDILLALKAIGNAGVATTFELLHNCYANKNLNLELRLTAIAAHRRFNCARNVNLDDFKNYFASSREVTEIRIASYLAIVQCASYAVFAQVKDVLTREETNQVGSFVWTHLTNLQETSVQWKQGLKGLLENEFLRNKFNTDVRKYSRNYEASAFFDSVGVGGAVESNVIFTTESYLPKSAMLNFTADLFGETVNFLEIGARLEGFEEVVENLFGPKGYFSDGQIKAFLENARNTKSQTHDKIEELGDSYLPENLQKDPSGLMYLKVFGNELGYTHFRSLEDLAGNPVSTNRLVDDLLKFFSKNDVDYSKSILFLDSSYRTPTILGFPLNLAANGTATIGLTVQGNVDLKEFWSHKLGIKGKIYPSLAVRINAAMTVETSFTRAGLKYIGTMNSNTYIDGHIFIDSGKLVDLKINVPKNQIDVINIASDVMIIHKHGMEEIRNEDGEVENYHSCTSDFASKATGLQLCSHLNFINATNIEYSPYFPLTGKFRYSLNIKKSDYFDNYVLSLKTITEGASNRPAYSTELYIDTPNSKINRKIKASYRLDCEKLSLDAEVLSPFANFQIHSKLGNERNRYNFQLLTSYNNKEILSLQSFLQIDGDGKSWRYEPTAKINYHEKEIVSLLGSISYIQGNQYSADLKLEGVTKEPITVVGDLTCNVDDIKLRSTLNYNSARAKIIGAISKTKELVRISASSDYNYGQGKDHFLSLLLELSKVRRGSVSKDAVKFELESTEKPVYNMYLNFGNERSSMFFENKGYLKFFATTWETQQLLKLNQLNENPDVAIILYLQCKEKNIDYRINLIYRFSRNGLKIHALAQLNQEHRVELLITYDDSDIEKKLYGLIYYPKHTWSLNGLIENIQTGIYKFSFGAYKTSDGEKIQFMTLSGGYTNSSSNNLNDVKVDCILDLHDNNRYWGSPWNISYALQNSKDTFRSFTKLTTANQVYISHLNWIDNSFALILQANDKRLLVINGERSSNMIGIMLALNIYQHFELTSKLTLPLEKFSFVVYWDKDRDENKRLLFEVENNRHKGMYNVDIEYPNQKIAAAVILLPTQAILNVTWGLVVSQKIYLKMGNRIYDVGGSWFGELETPFQYLEKQEFKLKYYLGPSIFEVQSDIAWRSHSIQFMLSGRKSIDELAGFMQLNTTLSEISKVATSLRHTHGLDGQICNTEANFVFNEHVLKAQSKWHKSENTITSSLEIESPSNTIRPISAAFLADNLPTDKKLTFSINWNDKSIRARYHFVQKESLIEILTPFEGFESTVVKYSVVSKDKSIYMSVTVDLLKNYNMVALSWDNSDQAISCWVSLISPITGNYYLAINHSKVLGVLHESFKLNGPNDTSIASLSLHLEAPSVLNLILECSAKLLNNTASLTVFNENKSTLTSKISLRWNDFHGASYLLLRKDEERYLIWELTSTVQDILQLRHSSDRKNHLTEVKLFNNCQLRNELILENIVLNHFELKAPGLFSQAVYNHSFLNDVFEQLLRVNINQQELFYKLDFTKKLNASYNLELNVPVGNETVVLRSNGSFNKEQGLFTLKTNNWLNAIKFIQANYSLQSHISTGSLSLYSQDRYFSLEANSTTGVINVLCKTDNFNSFLTSQYKKTGEAFNLTYVSSDGTKLEGKYNLNSNLNALLSLRHNNTKYLELNMVLSTNNGSLLINYDNKNLRMNYIISIKNQNINFKSDLSSEFDSIPNSLITLDFISDKHALAEIKIGDYGIKNKAVYTFESNTNQILGIINNDFDMSFPSNKFKFDINCNLKVVNGSLRLDLNSLVNNSLNTSLQAGYIIKPQEYRSSASLKFNEDLYLIQLLQTNTHDSFEIASSFQTPSLGEIKLNIDSLYVGPEVNLTNVITTVFQLKEFKLNYKLVLLEKEYNGIVDVAANNIELSFLGTEAEVNRFLYYRTNATIQASLQLDVIELVPQIVSVAYGVDESENRIRIEYDNDYDSKYALDIRFDQTKLNASVSIPGDENYGKIFGRHKFDNLTDFLFTYSLYKDGILMRVDAMNYFGDIYQTRLDVTSKLKGWRRFMLESKIDDDKIRISLNAMNYHMSLLSNKLTSEDNTVLSIQFQGETLLEIQGGRGQITLRTSSRFGRYRLFIQCTQNPGIFLFSILRDRENLISLMLQNVSTDQSVNLRGKLVAPELIPNHGNLSFQIDVDQDIIKSFKILINNGLMPLFELRWLNEWENDEYSGYLKFNSKIDAVPDFEIYPVLNINNDFVFNLSAVVINLNDILTVNAIILLTDETSKILITCPCKDLNQCSLNISIDQKTVDFHLASPYEQYKDVSFSSNLTFTETGVYSSIKLKQNSQVFETMLSTSFNQEHAELRATLDAGDALRCSLSSIIFSKSFKLEAQKGFSKCHFEVALKDQTLMTNTIIQLENIQHFVLTTKVGKEYLIQGVSNNEEVIFFKAGRLNGADLVRYLKLSVNFSFKYLLNINLDLTDREEQLLEVWFNSNENFLNNAINFHSKLNCRHDALKCNIDTQFNNITNQLSWMYSTNPDAFVTVLNNYNNHIKKIEFKYGLRDIDTYLHISSDERKMRFAVKNEIINYDQMHLTLLLETPLPSLEQIKSETTLKYYPNSYYMNTNMTWPNNGMMALKSNAVFKKLYNFNLDFISSFTQSLTSDISFGKDKNNVSFNFETKVGPEFVRISTNVFPMKRINANLSSSFESINNCELVADVDEDRVVLNFNSNLLKINGVLKKDKDVYEGSVRVNYPTDVEEVANAFVKLENSKFNASFHFPTSGMLMNVGVDKNIYNVYLKSPYNYAKEVELYGVYTNDINDYSIETFGQWNRLEVNVNGFLKVSPTYRTIYLRGNIGEEHKGLMNFTYVKMENSRVTKFLAYYPDVDHDTFFNFDLNKTNSQLAMKTPFENFRKLNVLGTFDPNKDLRVIIDGDILNQAFEFSSWMRKNVGFEAGVKYLLANQQCQIEVSGNLDRGSLNIHHLTTDGFNNISFDYLKSDMEIAGSYILWSSRYNASHTFMIRHRNIGFIDYELGLDNNRIAFSYNPSGISANFLVNLPLYNIEESSVNFLFGKTKQNYLLKYSDFYIKSNLDFNQMDVINISHEQFLPFQQKISRLSFEYNATDKTLNGRISTASSLEYYVKGFHKKDELELTMHSQYAQHLQLNYISKEGHKKLAFNFWEQLKFNLERINNKEVIEFHLNEPASVHIELRRTLDRKNFYLNYQLHTAPINTISYKISSNTLSVQIQQMFEDVLRIDAVLKQTARLEFSALIKYLNASNYFEVAFDTTNKYALKLYLQSPIFDEQIKVIQIEAVSIKNINFYVASGVHYFLYNHLISNKSITLLLQYPPHIITCDFTIKWDLSNGIINTNGLTLNTSLYGNSFVTTSFILQDDALDMTTNLSVPFLKGFETFEGKIRVPIEFRPLIYLQLSDGSIYSLSFNHSFQTTRMLVDANAQFASRKFDLHFDHDNKKSKAQLHLPDGNSFEINYNASLHNHEVLLKANGRKYELGYSNINWHKIYLSVNDIVTYSLETHCDFVTKKQALLMVFYPGLIRAVGAAFETEISEDNYVFKYAISLPFQVKNVTFINLEFQYVSSDIDWLLISGSTDNYHAKAELFRGNRELRANLKFNKQYFRVYGKLLQTPSMFAFEAQLHLSTPFSLIENLAFQSSSLFAEEYHSKLILKHNNNNIINTTVNFLPADKNIILISKNIWQPFTIQCNYEPTNIYANFGFNSSQPSVGIYYNLKPTFALGAFFKNYCLHAKYVDEPSNYLSFWNSTWNGRTVAVNISQTPTTSNIKIQLPFQKLEISNTKNLSLTDFKLIWGEEKNSSLRFTTGENKSTLTIPALSHDIIVIVDTTKYKQIPSHFQASLLYSNDPDKKINIVMIYEKNDTFYSRHLKLSHPASKIDHELHFEVEKMYNETSGNIILKYRNFEINKTQSIRSGVVVDRNRFGVNGFLISDKNSITYKINSLFDEDKHGFSLEAKINDKDPIYFECFYNSLINPSINLLASYGNERRYNFNAGWPNEREINTILQHELYGGHYTDASLIVKLNTTQMLWIKATWRKQLYASFYKIILEEYADVRYFIESLGRETIDVIDDDFGVQLIEDLVEVKQNLSNYVVEERIELLRKFNEQHFNCSDYEICPLLSQPIVQEFYRSLITPIKKYLELFVTSFEQIYERAIASFQRSYDTILAQIEYLITQCKDVRHIKVAAKNLLKNVIRNARKSLKEMETRIITLLTNLDKSFGDCKDRVEEFFEPFLNLLDDFVAYVEQRLVILQIAILDIMDTVQRYIHNLREVKEVFYLYKSYINWLEELHITDILEPIGDVIESILETVIRDTKKIIENYRPYLDAISEALFGNYDGLNQLPPVTQLRELVNKIYQKTIWIWNYHNTTENLKMWIQKMSKGVDDVLSFIELDDKSKDFENPFQQTDYIIRPEIGLIEISQPLPVEWPAFNKPPALKQHPLYQKIQRKIEQFRKMYRNRYDFINGLQGFLSDLSESKIAPPAANFAMMIGDRYFATFNDEYYNVQSNCSYVLASDFKTNSFSLIVHRVGTPERYFEILSRDTSIVLDKNFAIEFNGERQDLPLVHGYITVTKEHENIVIEGLQGFHLNCNTYYNYCSVQLSGWLFGKTGGLLGSINNDNIMLLSNGSEFTNLPEFVNSWRIQEDCAARSELTVSNPKPNMICDAVFGSDESPLYECFDKVTPIPFLNMCANEDLSLCSIIAAYRSRCRKFNIDLDTPEMCLICNPDIGTQGVVYDFRSPKSLDVVFITQLNCVDKEMEPNLPEILEKELNSEGYLSNRYASVGFGGNFLSKPHVYTTNNSVWTNASDLQIRYNYDSENWNSRRYSAINALEYASNINFRPGIPKLFVMIQCEASTVIDNSAELYNMMGEKDITLHVLKPNPFGNITGLAGMSAADSDEEVMNKITDMYAILGLSTNGTVFDLNLVDAPNSQWAHTVATTTETSSCQICKCVEYTDGVPVTDCSRCLNPAVKYFLDEYESNTKVRF